MCQAKTNVAAGVDVCGFGWSVKKLDGVKVGQIIRKTNKKDGLEFVTRKKKIKSTVSLFEILRVRYLGQAAVLAEEGTANKKKQPLD